MAGSRRAPTDTTSARSLALLQGGAGLDARARTVSRSLRDGRGGGPAVRRHADAADGVARHAVRVRSAGGLRAVPRGRQRAAVPARSHADAAAAGRHPVARAGRSSSARCAAATSRAASRARATSIRAFARDFHGPVHRSAFRPATRPGPCWTLPLGVRVPRGRRAPRPARRSSRSRPLSDVEAHSSDRHLRHGDGDAGRAAEAPRPRRAAAPTRTSTRR